MELGRRLSLIFGLLVAITLVTMCRASAATIFNPPSMRAVCIAAYNSASMTVDGVIDQQEWAASTAFTGFMDNSSRSFSSRQTVVYACYTSTSLYFAFESDAPVDYDNDKYIIALNPGSNEYIFAVTPNAGISTVVGAAGPVYEESTVSGGKWRCEVRIPFSSINASTPGNNSYFHVNFARVFTTPYADTTRMSSSPPQW